MIELNFFNKGYGASKIYEDEDCYVSLGSDSQGKEPMAFLQLKRMGIELVGGRELFLSLHTAFDTPEAHTKKPTNVNVEKLALDYLLQQIDSDKFRTLIIGLAKDRYDQGVLDGQETLQSSLRNLLGL